MSDRPGRYIPTLGGALRDDDEEAAHSLAETTRQVKEAEARAEAASYTVNHLCVGCFHESVCSVATAVRNFDALVTISRCQHFIELPEIPEPEPAK